MKKQVIILLSATGFALAGCADGPNHAETGTVIGAVAGGILGNQVGSGTGKVLATAAGVVIGGIVGHNIGRALDENDRRLAQEAEFAALEEGQSGEAVPWRNPDSGHYGEVIPNRAYRRGDSQCREYEHRVWIDGRREIMRGTACRNPDGTWRSVA